MNHILKNKNRNMENREPRISEYSGAHGLFLLLLCFFLALSGCATSKPAAKNVIQPQESAAITGIDVQDNSVTVTASKPFIYTIYRPGDPYKVVVDLPDMTIGAFNKKIVSQRAGIAEIRPTQIDSPALMTRIEILLQNPSLVDQEYKNGVLKMKIKEDPSEKTPQQGIKLADASREVRALAARRVDPLPDPPARAPLSKATEISDISFDVSSGTVKVLIKGNGSMTPNVFPLDNRIVIDIADITLNATIPSTVVSPVKGMRAGKHDDKVRLVIDLKEKTNFDVTAIGDSIVVTLKRLEKEPVEPLFQARTSGEKTESQESSPETLTEKTEIEAPLRNKCEAYLQGRENVNFDFQDQDIVPIIRLFADISGCNLFIHPDVKGKATMKFRDVPWNQAFDTILKTFGLGKSVEGNIIRVAPYSVFAKESEDKVKAVEAGMKAEPLDTKMFSISYADVSVVETAIKNSKILTSRGSMSVDKRTSSMLVKDVASVFPQIENLLATLDKPTPQVLIEARIVEVNSTDVADFGIQWGLKLNASNTLMSLGGFPSLGKGAFTGNNFLVDVPSGATGPGSGSGISFGVLNPQKTLGLDIQLDALEKMGKSKIISNPKIVTVDNEKATIMQGTSEPYPVISTGTATNNITTAFKDVALSTEVTPHITPSGAVSMTVLVKKEDILGTVLIGGSPVPRTSKVEGNTKVLVMSGETLVIGGVYKKTETESVNGVPGLMKIPILGWLFKNKEINEVTSELLIFITPRIVENLEKK